MRVDSAFAAAARVRMRHARAATRAQRYDVEVSVAMPAVCCRDVARHA